MRQLRIYETPRSEILCFMTEDVIMTSGITSVENGGTGKPGKPDKDKGDKPGNGWGDKNHDHSGPPGHTGIKPGKGNGRN